MGTRQERLPIAPIQSFFACLTEQKSDLLIDGHGRAALFEWDHMI